MNLQQNDELDSQSKQRYSPFARWRNEGETSLTFRLKGFASTADLPLTDFNRSDLGSRREDGALDLRTMLQHDVGNWSFELAHTALVQ